MELASGSPSSLISSSSHSKSSMSSVPGNKGQEADTGGLSPTDIEIRIQSSRFIAVLDESILKTKLVVCLPFLMKDGAILKRVLTPEHFHSVRSIYQRHNNSFSGTHLNLHAVEAVMSGDYSIRNRLSTELVHLIFILAKYSELNNIVEERLALNEASGDASGSMAYLRTLQYFREVMLRRLEKTAAEDLSSRLQHRKISESNTKLKQEINDIQKTMKEEKQIFEIDMEKKKKVTEDLKKKLKILEADGHITLAKNILDTERQMVLASRAHRVRDEVQKEEENEWTENNANNMDRNLTEEKAMRARRIKVTTQLVTWIQKYDGEMGEKQVELDEIIALYDGEAKTVEELEAKLAEQDEEYLPLMEEREKEYHDEMNRKKALFMREHAARVMQFAWRTVIANRHYKAKMKKLAKKLAKLAAAGGKEKK